MNSPVTHNPSELLAAFRDRLLARAVMCGYHREVCVSQGWWHEAHEAEVRRDIWLRAADMATEEQKAANDKASDLATPK